MLGVVRISSSTDLDGDDAVENLMNQRIVGTRHYKLLVEGLDLSKISLFNTHLTVFIELMAKLKPVSLAFVRVTFMHKVPEAWCKRRFINLQEITMASCHEAISFIHCLIKMCPRLRSLQEYGDYSFTSSVKDYWRRQYLLEEVGDSCKALSSNYHMVKFKSESMEQELKKLFNGGIPGSDRNQFTSYKKAVKVHLERNQGGLQKCRDAVYQLFLIKRYRPDSVFRFVALDVVKIIARMVYASNQSNPKLWCS